MNPFCFNDYLKLAEFDIPWYFYFILLIFSLVAWLQSSQKVAGKRRQVTAQVETLALAYEEIRTLMDKDLSLESIAELTKQKYLVPEVITLRYLSLFLKDRVTNGIYPLFRQQDEKSLKERLRLLDQYAKQYNLRITDHRGSILDLDEAKNVFYLQKQVVGFLGKIKFFRRDKFGIFILSTHYVMFIKYKSLKELFGGEEMEELLSKVTEEIPLLHFGVLTGSLVKLFGQLENSEKSIFTESAKNRLLNAYNNSECIFLSYRDIKAMQYPNRLSRLGSPKLRITTVNDATYTFFTFSKEEPPFFDQAFKTVADLCLSSGNLLLPESPRKPGNWVSFYLSP